MIYFVIFLYFISLVIVYYIITKRLKHIIDKQIEYTKASWLLIWFKKTKRIIFVLLFTLFIVCSVLILNFF